MNYILDIIISLVGITLALAMLIVTIMKINESVGISAQKSITLFNALSEPEKTRQTIFNGISIIAFALCMIFLAILSK